jgi:hypothetical protein
MQIIFYFLILNWTFQCKKSLNIKNNLCSVIYSLHNFEILKYKKRLDVKVGKEIYSQMLENKMGQDNKKDEREHDK